MPSPSPGSWPECPRLPRVPWSTVSEHLDPRRDLGSFIREQRAGARLSLRRLSELAGISNPYLSQIERGLRRPSAEILQQIAHGLRISAETLYVRAGILDERPESGDLALAILEAPALNEEQKQTLLHIYRSFVAANGDSTSGPGDDIGESAVAAGVPGAPGPSDPSGAPSPSAGAPSPSAGAPSPSAGAPGPSAGAPGPGAASAPASPPNGATPRPKGAPKAGLHRARR